MSDEFKDNSENVLKAVDKAFKKAGNIIGGLAETQAKRNIRDAVYSSPQGWYIRTGNLRNSITHEYRESDKTVVIGTNVKYAPYVELGTGVYAEGGNGRKTPWRYQDAKGNWHATSGMKPRPFLRPVFEEHRDEYMAVLKKVFEEDLK